MKKLHYLAGRHCGLCKIIAPAVTSMCQQYGVTFCNYFELPVMPEHVRHAIMAAKVDKLPIIAVETDDGQVTVFRRDDDGRLNLKKLEGMMQ